jgi:hypothetical protein
MLVGAALVLGLTAMPSVIAAQVGERKVLNVDQLTARQFRERLVTVPDDAVLERRGERMTAGELRAKMRLPPEVATAQARAIAQRVEANDARAGRELGQARARFGEQQQTRLEADNARARAELARLRETATIEREAVRLWRSSKTASPRERAQIDARAGQLQRQLDSLNAQRR